MLDEIKAYQEAAKAVRDTALIFESLERSYSKAMEDLQEARRAASVAARVMSQAIHRNVGVDGDRLAGVW